MRDAPEKLSAQVNVLLGRDRRLAGGVLGTVDVVDPGSRRDARLRRIVDELVDG
jgi:hypothetical protein